MAYNKAHENINWQNLPSEATALNAINFNKMDNSIDVIDNRVIALDTARINDEASLANKVDKVAGKGLSTNDYTTTEKNKLAGIEAGAQVNTVTGVKGNSEGSYRTGNVNITKANIGLGNVDNTSDANKPVSTATQTALGNKVDKVAGKGLSTNDYTDAEKTKLAGIETGANKTIVDSSLSGSSTNPVQNKVAKSALDGKVDKVTNYGLSLYKDIGYYQTAEGQTGTYIGYVGGKNQNGQLQALGDIYNGVVVDSALSSSSTNPVENKAIYDALNNLLPSKTVSGNPISISDASGLNAKALTVSMNPIQDLHGYDNPWVGGAGKNKLPNTYSTTTYRGITYTVSSDGKVVATGEASGGNSILDLVTNLILPSGTYKINGISGGETSTYRMRYRINSGSYNTIFSGESEFTVNGTDVLEVQIVMFSGYSCPTSGITFEPMIRLSTVADTTFAPYSNICPISGWDGLNLTRTGKNLAKPYVKASNIVSYDGNGNVTVNGTSSGTLYVPTTSQAISDGILFTLKAGTYIPSLSNPYPNNDIFVNVVAKDNTNLSQGSAFTITEDTEVYARVVVKQGTYNNWTSGIQLELGSTATAYEPYQGEAKTHQYSETIYGGTDDFVNGELTNEWKFITLTSVSSMGGGSGTNIFFRIDIPNSEKGINTASLHNQPISNYFFSDNTANHVLGGAFITSQGTSLHITFSDQTIDTMEKANTYLTNNPLQVCYKLATPTEITLTPQEIELLKGQNVLSTNADYMELKYSVSLDSLLPTTTRTLAKSPIVEEPKEETDETEEQR